MINILLWNLEFTIFSIAPLVDFSIPVTIPPVVTGNNIFLPVTLQVDVSKLFVYICEYLCKLIGLYAHTHVSICDQYVYILYSMLLCIHTKYLLG